ncbi:MAG TPA: hypothetical protein DEA62_03450 [Coxiellaceae bacterium]|nr:MAG: hypothetical protein A2V89_01840 [Gammaproteobacteria bacterium RBG_16_37_9]HBS52024.1 hypothetical protein [Coxiellaceae bacterium]
MKLKNNPDVEIMRSSNMVYEKLTIEIYYKGEPIAQINQDQGKNALELELFTEFNLKEEFRIKMPLLDFMDALVLAQKSLTENTE